MAGATASSTRCGTTPASCQVGSLLDVSPEEWRRVFAVNVEGALFGTQAALRQMLDQPIDPTFQRRGLIVNTSSGAADRGRPMLPAYGASKAAMTHLMKSTAASYGERGICADGALPEQHLRGDVEGDRSVWGELEGLPPGEMGRRRTSESLLGPLRDAGGGGRRRDADRDPHGPGLQRQDRRHHADRPRQLTSGHAPDRRP